MRYAFEYNASAKVLEMVATGVMENEFFPEVVRMFWQLLSENDCHRAIIDYRNFEFTNCTIEILKRPKIVLEIGGARFFRLAMVVDSICEDYSFLETVYRNKGVDAKIFTDWKEAFAWLQH